ncbi:hypothetical protein CYMTET_11829 [Cymbomonas tetramitiformis]|uniref:Uncharacterized protein n=1 Tax=Cymbomonas tetramitiformis TaxID=36881 RepID=A0AAE0LD31_9CHLO|nr:hypothetical protein CYMTET_33421 [Cymbomonas tetramitiformis]KAK3280325.1 hypothetical protein CYMTET_11829 [Cymbomonas tetramitiformis]
MSRKTLACEGVFSVPPNDVQVYRVLETDMNGYKPDNTPILPNDAKGCWGNQTSTDHPINSSFNPEDTFNRGTLEWPHMEMSSILKPFPVEWKSTMKDHFASQGGAPANKRHTEYYYQHMSGTGIPSVRDKNHGFPGKEARGLGNVTHVQVPHSANFVDT